jgi:hypothetical protein
MLYDAKQMKAALPQAALDRLLESGIAGVTQHKLDDVKVYIYNSIHIVQHTTVAMHLRTMNIDNTLLARTMCC